MPVYHDPRTGRFAHLPVRRTTWRDLARTTWRDAGRFTWRELGTLADLAVAPGDASGARRAARAPGGRAPRRPAHLKPATSTS
jgi:hypothetical protein